MCPLTYVIVASARCVMCTCYVRRGHELFRGRFRNLPHPGFSSFVRIFGGGERESNCLEMPFGSLPKSARTTKKSHAHASTQQREPLLSFFLSFLNYLLATAMRRRCCSFSWSRNKGSWQMPVLPLCDPPTSRPEFALKEAAFNPAGQDQDVKISFVLAKKVFFPFRQ